MMKTVIVTRFKVVGVPVTAQTDGTSAQTGTLEVSISPSGEVPDSLLQSLGKSVKRAVLAELAEIDIGPGYRIADLGTTDVGAPGGVVPAAAPETNIGIIIIINR
jgi:hypothetical protein